MTMKVATEANPLDGVQVDGVRLATMLPFIFCGVRHYFPDRPFKILLNAD
jgi:hypothetical protein